MSLERQIQIQKNPLILLLSHSQDYSNVYTISDFLGDLESNNLNFKSNIATIFRLNYIDRTFPQFIEKTIICFPSIPQYNYNSFMNQFCQIESVSINSNITLLNLLAEALSDIVISAESNNYVQSMGIKLSLLYESSNNLLRVFTNRLINTKMFEILRLCIGDWVLLYIMKYCTLFVFDEKVGNYFQVLGYSFRDTIEKLLRVPSYEKIISNSYNFQKVFSSPSNINYYSSAFTGFTDNSKSEFKKVMLTAQFTVERTKIYYCANFNRKLGFFKQLRSKANTKQNSTSNSQNFGQEHYYILFEKVDKIIPEKIKTYIIETFNKIQANILKFDFPRVLFSKCPLMKDYKKIKKEILSIIKSISKEEKKEKLNENFDALTEHLKTLINSNIPYEKIFRFTINFLSRIIPKDLLGKQNFLVLVNKVKSFIEMNRFETFNRINLFDSREFFFTQMKWLNLTQSSKKYSETGILLKNFIMKSIIYWIFNFAIVQLFRSHFFITEKQGDHFKTFYYHKIIYDLIIKICFSKYIHFSQQYKVVTKEDAVDHLKKICSAFGKLRLMPKPSTMRPITSFKRKTMGDKKFLKNKFFKTQKIFKFIQNKMQKFSFDNLKDKDENKNCVVFDYKEIMKRLINIKLRLIKTKSSAFRENKLLTDYLSFVTMDIEACYDNIDINLLNSFLDKDNTISPTYITGILHILIPKLNKVKQNSHSQNNLNTLELKDCFDMKLVFIVGDLKEYIHPLDLIRKSTDIQYKNCIIYLDPKGTDYIAKATFIPEVRDIVNNNYIKFNRYCLKQIKGIPQGLSVSSFLCNLFFYEVEYNIANEIQKQLTSKESLLMRFMDDYLCLSTLDSEAKKFKEVSVKLSQKNKFNFNLKKSQTNLERKEGEQSVTKFTWNGIYFELSQENFFNLIYEVKISTDNIEDINEFKKLININLPLLKNNKDPSWLVKKINSMLFSGNPWIYFLSTINEKVILEENLKNFIRFFLFKLIVLVRRIVGTQLELPQKLLIEAIDTSIVRMFSFFDGKISDIEGKSFFIGYYKFHRMFYVLMFQNYFSKEDETSLNKKMISYCPLLFKAIKRKIERMKLCKTKSNTKEAVEKMEVDIKEIEKKLMS